MVERLMILAPAATPEDAQARLRGAGGRVLARYGDRVWVAEMPPEADATVAGDPAIQGVYAGAIPDPTGVDDDAGRLGIAAWNLRQSASFRAARRTRTGEGRSWDDEGFEPEG
jgi:hypothetical protein